MSGKLHQMIMDVFEQHNPAQLSCMSVYRPIVADLLRNWSYSDDEGDVKCYINDLMIFHLKTFKFELSGHFVAEVYGLRGHMK